MDLCRIFFIANVVVSAVIMFFALRIYIIACEMEKNDREEKK